MKRSFKIFVVISIFIFFLLEHSLFSYKQEDLDKIRSGSCFMMFADLNYAPLMRWNLNNVNLSNAWVMGASFRKSSLKNAWLYNAKAVEASFHWADLEGADLREGNFRDALFYGANLKVAKVKDAGFRNVRGLTNEQKKYLRENGALYVPADLTPEEFEKERLQVEEEIKSSWAYKIDKMIDKVVDRIFCCFKKNKKKKTE